MLSLLHAELLVLDRISCGLDWLMRRYRDFEIDVYCAKVLGALVTGVEGLETGESSGYGEVGENSVSSATGARNDRNPVGVVILENDGEKESREFLEDRLLQLCVFLSAGRDKGWLDVEADSDRDGTGWRWTERLAPPF